MTNEADFQIEGASPEDLMEYVTALGRKAIADPKVLQIWIDKFPGMCPACMIPHATKRTIVTRGICVACRIKIDKAQKELAQVIPLSSHKTV